MTAMLKRLRPIALICVLTAPSLAQYEQAAITGTIRDSQTGVIADARIQIRHVATGLIRSTTSTSAGVFFWADSRWATTRSPLRARALAKFGSPAFASPSDRPGTLTSHSASLNVRRTSSWRHNSARSTRPRRRSAPAYSANRWPNYHSMAAIGRHAAAHSAVDPARRIREASASPGTAAMTTTSPSTVSMRAAFQSTPKSQIRLAIPHRLSRNSRPIPPSFSRNGSRIGRPNRDLPRAAPTNITPMSSSSCQRRLRCAQSLRPSAAAVPAESVRRQLRRTAGQEQDLRLRRLRGLRQRLDQALQGFHERVVPFGAAGAVARAGSVDQRIPDRQYSPGK